MDKRSFSFGLLAVLFTIGSQSAYAQGKLNGGVQMSVDPSMRIDRSTLRQSTGVESSDFRMNLTPQQAQTAPLLDASAFQGSVTQTPAPLLRTAVTQTATPKPEVKKDQMAPYIWHQSAMGGYFDGSGTTKDLVRANKLHIYGGKFADGTIVPKREILDYNEMGHAFRGFQLNTAHFWSR